MLAECRLLIASAILVVVTFPTHAAAFPGIPQAELTEFCQEGGPGIHLATFFMDDGLRLRGHVDCATATFTLSMILPPIG
jgi:hypothetical protein